MKTMNTQRGMTLTSFLAVLIVVAFGLYVGMKLFRCTRSTTRCARR